MSALLLWDATLVTNNTRHFTGFGIALEDWTVLP